MSSEPPRDPLHRVDSLLETIGQAHMAIFSMHRVAVDRGRNTDRANELLRESVQIVFENANAVARTAHAAGRDHALRALLEAEALESAEESQRVVAEAESALEEFLRHQERIAEDLNALTSED